MTCMKSDKLNLLYLMNKNEQVAVKTPYGSTKRVSITNKLRQERVWGSILCTATMDKLGKLKYNNKEMLYKYKETVGVPALDIVDDIVDIQACGVNAVMSNAVINSCVEHKKLTLSKTICHRLHCGEQILCVRS